MYHTVVWDVDSGGGYESVEEGGVNKKFLYFPLNFAQNLKLF